MNTNLYKKIMDTFLDNNIDIYAPNQKTDKCTKEYVVLKQNNTIAENGNISGYDAIELFCYVPEENYSKIFELKDKVKEIVKNNLPNMKKTGNESPVIFMQDILGYLGTIEYFIPHKL